MAARQVLQPAADQNAAGRLRFVGIGEIHLLFHQEWAQMFVDLLERGVVEGLIGALLGFPVLDFVEGGPVLEDFDAGKLFQNPALRGAKCEFGFFRLEAITHLNDPFELCDIGAGIERQFFDQFQSRSAAV